jgi:hypothetical protein
MDWLKYGDRNTKFYHSQAMQRRKINRTKRLRREDGSCVQEADLREYIAAQYGELFTSQGVHRINEVLTKVEPRITPEMNASLRADYTAHEIKEALDSIGDLKAPGPDGMPVIFFKILGNSRR